MLLLSLPGSPGGRVLVHSCDRKAGRYSAQRCLMNRDQSSDCVNGFHGPTSMIQSSAGVVGAGRRKLPVRVLHCNRKINQLVYMLEGCHLGRAYTVGFDLPFPGMLRYNLCSMLGRIGYSLSLFFLN
ncbi:hypothetical protein RRG08_066245 [Elysia crispata]|uniref:Uncharacterized protein n=1 Tax=Elysia crispata TaxID=231223 RepID=A0AAE1BCZ4_9GAST|nr:hypothetical protein RRG08_066245 [Elysia crispata]